MRRKIVTPTGEADLLEISRFISADSLTVADRYLIAALAAFESLPDIHTPVRAGEHLPERVHVLQVPGFSGYTLRIAIYENETYLIAAFRPGLPDEYKDARTSRGLEDV